MDLSRVSEEVILWATKEFSFVTLHDAFTAPMREHVASNARREGDGYSICSARPRVIDGRPTKNPRYLQLRPDMAHPRDRYVAEMGARLNRRLPLHTPVHFPVISVLSGRRNNRQEEGIRPLCVYGPIHYQELPELFMDYVCSLTGTSPSTTGAGSEGALTKGPFNALAATADLNNALVAMLLTGYAGFSSAAGFIGPRYRVDHDISLLVPEIWCRLAPHERDPAYLIEKGYLEPVKDFEYEGETVHASRLGYRITGTFVRSFFGRVFDNPAKVFDDAILKPETQGLASFVDGVKNICEAQQRVARQYFEDGSVRELCPPLRVLMSILAFGSHDGMTAQDPEVRLEVLRVKIIEAIDLRREDVYIANVIKCRPPGNRNPEPDEVEQCEPFLFRQIDIIKPKVIVALGKFAAQCLLKSDAPITRIRGREFTYRDSILIPTYHPAYLLRNPSAKRDVWEDMKRVRALLSQDARE